MGIMHTDEDEDEDEYEYEDGDEDEDEKEEEWLQAEREGEPLAPPDGGGPLFWTT